ncbi:hypothetical protein COJ23_24280 [Priestia megaterium]|nr:hypothetical protein COJ23_24280 [Priestia megaterium]
MNVRKKIKKRLLASVLFFKKTLQNKVTLEGTFHTHEGVAEGVPGINVVITEGPVTGLSFDLRVR